MDALVIMVERGWLIDSHGLWNTEKFQKECLFATDVILRRVLILLIYFWVHLLTTIRTWRPKEDTKNLSEHIANMVMSFTERTSDSMERVSVFALRAQEIQVARAALGKVRNVAIKSAFPECEHTGNQPRRIS